MNSANPIAEFWSWFQTHADQIRQAYGDGDKTWLDEHISPRVRRIQKSLNWEIGPYHNSEDTFVLSPTIRANLTITRDAVAQAPQIPGWHFAPVKPEKELTSLVFSVADSTICADNWRYHLTSYNDGEFVDIELLIDSNSGFPASQENLFSELVVESLIGEECRLDRVGYISPKIVKDNTCSDRATPIRHLKAHLSQVLTPTTENAEQDAPEQPLPAAQFR